MGFWTTTLPLHPLLPLVALRLLAVKFFVLAGALGDAQLSDQLRKVGGMEIYSQVI